MDVPPLLLDQRFGISGIAETKQVGSSESRVANWSGFNLDTEPDGRVYKPDSLYMKAFKL